MWVKSSHVQSCSIITVSPSGAAARSFLESRSARPRPRTPAPPPPRAAASARSEKNHRPPPSLSYEHGATLGPRDLGHEQSEEGLRHSLGNEIARGGKACRPGVGNPADRAARGGPA